MYGAVSPSREKKRSFAQAELEKVSPNHEVTEDDLRRNQGPPKAKTKNKTGDELKEATEFELKSADEMCQSSHGKHKLDEGTPAPTPDASKPVPPAENTTKCHQSAPDVGHCLKLPLVKAIRDYNVKASLPTPLLKAGMESSPYLMESPRSCPSSRRSLGIHL